MANATVTYPEEIIERLAFDIGNRYQWYGLVLKEGESAWNPASTCRHLYGPSLIEYGLHPTGIQVHEFDLDNTCKGGDRDPETYAFEPCTEPRLAHTTRCQRHIPPVPVGKKKVTV